MKNEMTPLATLMLRLPLQVSPVDRTLVGLSSLSHDGGVVASQGLAQLLQPYHPYMDMLPTPTDLFQQPAYRQPYVESVTTLDAGALFTKRLGPD
jgi:hypothetical protein